MFFVFVFLCTPAHCARENPLRCIADTAQLQGPGDPGPHPGMSDSSRVRSQRVSGLLPSEEEGAPRDVQIPYPPQEADQVEGADGGLRGVNSVSSLWEHAVNNKGQIKTTTVVVPEGTRLKIVGSRAMNLTSAAFLKWENGVVREHPGVARCSKAPVLPQNEWIPQPLPYHSQALPPGCTTLEGRNLEKMRCHVRYCARGRVCANSSNTWGPRIWASALHVGVFLWLFIVTRLEGEVYTLDSFKLLSKGVLYSGRARFPAEVAADSAESREPQGGRLWPLDPRCCRLCSPLGPAGQHVFLP